MAKYEARSEVTGTVWKVLVKPGDTIAEGDHLMIIESMKMEIPIVAQGSGRVADLLVEEGEPVSEGQVVAMIDS